MDIQLATLIVVDRKQSETPKPAVLANLEPVEADFLQRHVDYLRTRINEVEVPRTRFRPASSMPGLLKKIQRARKDDFLKISDIFASRLVSAMASATNPKPGLLTVLITTEQSQSAPLVSILKLDATHEAASFRELTRGGVRLRVLKKLLPSPEELQKGFS